MASPPACPRSSAAGASSLAASLASLSLSQAEDDTSLTVASGLSTIQQPTNAPAASSTACAVIPSAVHQFNTLIRDIKQLKKQHTCTTHDANHDDDSDHIPVHDATTDTTCHCHTLLQKYQQALSLASTIHSASSTATRQQLVDRITALNNRLLPPIERIDSRYTLHRRSNQYTLNISHSSRQYQMPADIYGRLYDYQRESVHWLCQLHADGTGGILGDDMGLGKTVQVSALLSVLFYSRLVHHVLLIVPTSLIDNWKAELQKWCPTLPLHLYTETPERRAKRLQQCLHSGGILLSTYGVLASLQSTPFDALVLDEGHRIKNADTQQTRQVKAIECGYRVLCTGTVVQNRLTELWCLMDFVCCGRLLGERREFKEQWSDVIEEGKHKGASVELRRLSDELTRKLSELIRPYIMRRTKEEIKARHAKQQQEQQQQQLEAAAAGGAVPLPLSTTSTPELRVQKNELVVWLYPSEAQRCLYTALLSSGSEVMRHAQNAFNLKRRPLDAMSLLRTLSSHPRLVRTDHKLCVGLPGHVFARQAADAAERAELVVGESEKVRMLLLLLNEHQRHGHRTLVFSWSVQMLDLVSLVLQHRAIPYLRIDGQVPPAKRTAIIEAFRQPSCAASVFLLSTGVGGVGLNLTSADRCVILEPDWNPAIDAQSVDRCYRIGQQHNVVVHRFVTIGTIEEIVYRKQVFKQSLTRLVQGGKEEAQESGWVAGEEGGGGAQFTREELRGMFKLQDYRDSQTQRQLAAMYPPHLRHSYRELDEHIKLLQSQGIFGVTDHDLLSDHAANANRPPPLRTQQELDELDDPARKERVAAAAKRAKQRAEAMTERLQQYVPQPPAWPSLNRRKRNGDEERDEDYAQDEVEEKEEDWREGERRKEREEEKTAEWIDADDENQDNEEHNGDSSSEGEQNANAPLDEQQGEASGEVNDQHPSPFDAPWAPPVERAEQSERSAEEEEEEEEDKDKDDAVGESEDLDQAVYDTVESGGAGDAESMKGPMVDRGMQHRSDEEEQQQGEEDQAEPLFAVQRNDQEGCESEEETEPAPPQDDGHEQQRVGEEGGGAVNESDGRLWTQSGVDESTGDDEALEDQVDDKKAGEGEAAANEDEDLPILLSTGQLEKSGQNDEEDVYASAGSDSNDTGANNTAATDCGEESETETNAENSGESEQENQYEVEAIVDKRIKHGRIEYKVRWEGYGLEDDSWQTEDRLMCDELVEEYERSRREEEAGNAGERSEQGEEGGDWTVGDAEVEVEEDEEKIEGDEGRDSGRASNTDWLMGSRQEDQGEHDETGGEQHDDDRHSAAAKSPRALIDSAVKSASKDDRVDQDADGAEALAEKAAVDKSETDEAEDDCEAADSEAVYEDADEHTGWDDAVEWAADDISVQSTPATAPSAAYISATPVRLHVHASVALLMDDSEALSHDRPSLSSGATLHPSALYTPSSLPFSDTDRYRHLVQRAVQLVHTALHLPPPLPAESTCACPLRTVVHRLPQLTVPDTEEALDLLTQALQLSVTRCESVMEVAVVLMERLEQAFEETRRHERAPGAGVRRWLCV